MENTKQGACIITPENIDTEDDCTTHDHETVKSYHFPYDKEATTFPGPFHTIDQIKQANYDAGYHFFDASTMRFFGCRIAPGVAGGRCFITSEQDRDTGYGAAWDGARRYTLRLLRDDGSTETFAWSPEPGVDTDDAFGAYPTLRAARKALRGFLTSL